MKDPEPHLVGVDGAARYLGLSESWVRKQLSRQGLPHYRVGGAVRFDLRELEQYLERCRVEPRSVTAQAG